MVAKPRWLFDALTTEPLTFESLGAAAGLSGAGDADCVVALGAR